MSATAAALANVFGILVCTLVGAAGLIWVERRLLALWQDRYGPNRVGPFGLLQVVADEKDVRTTEEELNEMLSDARIGADVKVLPPLSGDQTIQQLIHEESGESDLVVLGLRFPEEGQESTFMTRMTSFMENLPTTVLVKSVNIEDIFS